MERGLAAIEQAVENYRETEKRLFSYNKRIYIVVAIILVVLHEYRFIGELTAILIAIGFVFAYLLNILYGIYTSTSNAHIEILQSQSQLESGFQVLSNQINRQNH